MAENTNWGNLPQLLADLAIIQKLDDEPNDVGGFTAAELKAKFDEAAQTIQSYLNNTLLPAVQEAGEAAEGDAGEAAEELETALNAHTEDAVRHISAAERTAWNGKQDALTFDSEPTAGSSNPVTSGGVKTALDGKLDTSLPIAAGTATTALIENAITGSNANQATVPYAHAEGVNTLASGYASHAEGCGGNASGWAAHKEGEDVQASGRDSHAEGMQTGARGDYSHAEGEGSSAEGQSSHAEGSITTASGDCSHSEGMFSTASGAYSHAEGFRTTASGGNAHAAGNDTIANHRSQNVFGEFNVADDSTAAATARGNYAEIVGNGTSNNARSNARTLDWLGNEWLAGKLTIGNPGTGNNDAVSHGQMAAEKTAAVNALTVLASTLEAGSSATVTKTVNAITGAVTLLFGIPKGDNGESGPQGAVGTTFTPSVSAAGVLSWTNDGGKQNPPSVDLAAAVMNALPMATGVNF